MPRSQPAEPQDPHRDVRTAARRAHLRYVRPDAPGIERRRSGRGFRYVGPDGTPVRDKPTLARVAALAIPPAWTHVWICPFADGHVQATGRDARGRKQYRYHDDWRRVRDEAKFDHLAEFARALPALRARVDADLTRRGMPRDKVLATIVRLLECTLVRVGNEEYARTNGSYGLTTLRNRHARIDGACIELQFVGKSGRRHAVDIRDRRLARIVQRSRELPGYELFRYVDEQGNTARIAADDVNGYLREVSGRELSAKDFRTWAATVLATTQLRDADPPRTKREARAQIAHAIEVVAERLRNTPAICRKSYVHPGVLAAYESGALHDGAGPRKRRPRGLLADEARVLAVVEAYPHGIGA